MAYSRGNYNFVIDSSFSPLTMQEMLVPFNTYKEVFENTKKEYDDLQQKADTFKYLSTALPEGSEARKMYEGYANDLYAKSQDFMNNGLSMGNKRGLMEMKRRYQGEIGELARADEALKKEQELRRTVAAKDPSMLYKIDNLTIDNFLNGKTPDTWGISGRELYAQAAAAGKAISSRVFSAGDGGKTLGGYFRDYVQRNGITQDQLDQFRDQILNDFSAEVTTLPKFQAAARMILDAEGVTDNLSGDNLRRAQQQVVRGLLDGAIYTEAHNPTRDPGKPSASEEQSLQLQKMAQAREAAMRGLRWNPKTETYDYLGVKKDPEYQRQVELQRALYDTPGNPEDPAIPNLGDYMRDPNNPGKLILKPYSERASTIENALSLLTKKELGNDEGFSINVGTKEKPIYKKYKYAGVIHRDKTNGEYYSGKVGVGEDNPSHYGWGFSSNSNVENKWGNFSMEEPDNDASVVPESEALDLYTKNKNIKNNVDKLIKEAGGNASNTQWCLIKVPREDDEDPEYAVAILDK